MSFNVEKFLADINGKWMAKVCPLCGHNEWAASDQVFEIRPFNGGAIIVGSGPIQPIVPITCTYCGNTIFINPMVSKALDGSEDGPDDKK